MTHKDIAIAIAEAYDTAPSAPLARYYREDGTIAVNTEEGYMTKYNLLTKRLRVLLYPHHETIGSFYLGDD